VLDRRALDQLLQEWLSAWNRHALEEVLAIMAEEVVFEHWDGKPLTGKAAVRRAWERWFARDKDFRFEWLNTIIDETAQRLSFEWRLHWMSPDPAHAGEREIRDGIDVIQLRDGEIVSKRTYIKTGSRMKPLEPATAQ
jgi:ketosteroid isomerase-like protein